LIDLDVHDKNQESRVAEEEEKVQEVVEAEPEEPLEKTHPVDLLADILESRDVGMDMIANAVTDCETAFVVYNTIDEEDEDNSGIQQVLFRDEIIVIEKNEKESRVDIDFKWRVVSEGGTGESVGGIEETIETFGGGGGEGYTLNTLAYLKKYGLE
jgi:hypothetical protein